jgi:FkbM family methyltransferase
LECTDDVVAKGLIVKRNLINRILEASLQKFAGRLGCTVVKNFVARERALDLACKHAFNQLELLFALISTETDDFTFVQIGANDGDRDDDLNCIVRQNKLRGLLVEPNPTAFARLKHTYRAQPHLQFEQCAITDDDSRELILWTIEGDNVPPQLDVFASTDRSRVERIARWHAGCSSKVRQRIVPALRFDELIHKHALSRVDAIVIDVEGMDGRIVNSIDLDCWRPALLQFEHRHLDTDELLQVLGRLVDRQYELIHTRRDIIAIQRDRIRVPAEPLQLSSNR